MKLTILGIISITLASIVVLLIAISLIVAIVRRKKDDTKDVTENVADLNDRFNRARYMNEDGN